MKTISKNFYIKSIIWCLIAGAVFAALSLFLMQNSLFEIGTFFLVIGSLLLIYSNVVFFVLVYKAWKYIQSEHSRTTPMKAIGFLLIPIFNIYWSFQAFWGWAKDYNMLIGHKNINAPKMPEKIIFTLCVMNIVAAFLPVLYLLIVPMLIFVVRNIIDGMNAIAISVSNN